MVWLVIISWSPAYSLSSHASRACQVNLSPPDFMLVLLLVLLDPDQVLPPQILWHVACCVRVMGQCLRHLETIVRIKMMFMVRLMILLDLLSCMHSCAVHKTVRTVN